MKLILLDKCRFRHNIHTTMKIRNFGSCLLFCAATALAATPFVPDDPFFFPGTDAGASPGFYGQWHLINNMPISASNAGIDANLAGAWAQGWTGQGVIISIIDSGSQGFHPDLEDGFRNEFSWDFEMTQAENLAQTYRGSPTSDAHGTSVAGVVAARGGNGEGVTGAAPYADFAAVRLIGIEDGPGYPSPGAAEAAAIRFQGQTDINGNPDPSQPIPAGWTTMPIRVKNHSYGPDQGYDPDDGQELANAALRESIDNGVIHVFAAGNQRIIGGNDPYPTADSSKIIMNNIPGVINVAALGSTGTYASYSSYGASVFVTAPSGDFSAFEIVTTDMVGPDAGYNTTDNPDAFLGFSGGYNYASDFSGTSSAAPLVSGIMALGVEANPDINARMAQHVLALTSVKVDPTDSSEMGGWTVNKAGYSFNNNYGFGLIDAGAFTETLTQVESLSEATTYEGPEVKVEQSFADLPSGNMMSQTYFVEVDPLHAQPLEYILIYLEISGLETDWEVYTDDQIGTILGDIAAWVESPSGTRHQLFFDDRDIYYYFGEEAAEERRDYHDDELDWAFISYAYWGEDVEGDWIIELYNYTSNDLTGVWESFSFEAGMGSISIIPEPGTFVLWMSVMVFALILTRRRQSCA